MAQTRSVHRMTSEARVADAEQGTVAHSEAVDVRRTWFGEPMRRLVVVALGLLAVAATLALVAAHRGTQLSLLDEPTHVDYAYDIAHGRVPAKGGLLDREVLIEWSCRGGPPGLVLPPCTDNPPPAASYPNRGEDYNFGHPPLYYALTGVTARIGNAIFPGHHFVALARMTGFVWLFAAMIVLYLALRRFSVRWTYAAAGAALLPLSPGVLHAASTVTNDAAAPLSGALALYLLAGLLTRHRIGIVAAVVVTALTTGTKVLNGVPMLLVAAVITVLAVVGWRRGDGRDALRLLLPAAGILITFIVVFKGWAVFQGGRGQANWASPIAGVSVRPIRGFPVNEIVSTSFSGFQLATGYWLQPQLDGESITLWSRLLNVLLAASPLVALAAFASRSKEWALGLATLGGLLAFPLVVELQAYVESHEYFPVVTPRYGMTLVPWAIACLAVVAAKKRIERTAISYVSVGVVVIFLSISGLWALGPAS